MDVQTAPFSTIPREIHERILHNCDYVTIIRFSLTCKKAYEVVSSSISLQLHIELDISGLEIADGSSKGNPNYALILKGLRDYQNAWLNFRLGPMVQQSLGTSIVEVNWEIRSGTYYGDFRASDLENDDFWVDNTQFVELGNPNIPPPVNFEKRFSFCVADPKQDLVVLIEDEQRGSNFARFYICSATTGKPHPLAEHPVLTVTFDSAFLHDNDLLDELMSANPEVMENYFAVNMEWREADCDASEFLLWDWRTGILLTRINAEDSASQYTFLDKKNLLVYSALPENGLQPTRLALLVYRIPGITPDHKVPPDANFHPSLYPKPSPNLIFEFPELHPSWALIGQHFISGSEPLSGDVVYTKSATLLCSRVTTLGLGFRIWNNPRRQRYVYGSRKGTPTYLQVFVSTHHLLTHLLGLGGQSEDIGRVIPWSQWGTPATRWFIGSDSITHSAGRIYGSQYIHSATIKSGRSQLISIVDFNAPVIKRHAYNSTAMYRARRTPADTAEKLLVLEGKGMTEGRLFQTRIASTRLHIPRVGQALNQEVVTETIGSEMKTIIRVGFKDPVISCLPYRVVTRVQRMPLHGHWRIHGEYLIGVPRRDWSDTENPYFSLFKLEFLAQV
ncbi:unnamed protein product [Rhizoctonia solani]|uniref:F-box domain-containing protein n=1 Tax=Rhizoctonia solani TaxID=456999 RepID=A0A8H3GTZ0_9AGAM|nr:unnamed protein product [Rhizoctonia solani]